MEVSYLPAMTITQSTSEVLKVDTAGRVRTPKEKRDEILGAYSGSGMTGKQFAAYVGMKYSTLMSWIGKAHQAGKLVHGTCKEPAMKWVEATVENGIECEALIVEIGKNVRMQVASPRQAALAGEIIRALGVVRPC